VTPRYFWYRYLPISTAAAAAVAKAADRWQHNGNGHLRNWPVDLCSLTPVFVGHYSHFKTPRCVLTARCTWNANRGVARNLVWGGINFYCTILQSDILAAWRHRLQLMHNIIFRDWFWEGIYTDIPPSLRPWMQMHCLVYADEMCLSVCLSVTPVYYIETDEPKQLRLDGSPATAILLYQRSMNTELRFHVPLDAK